MLGKADVLIGESGRTSACAKASFRGAKAPGPAPRVSIGTRVRAVGCTSGRLFCTGHIELTSLEHEADSKPKDPARGASHPAQGWARPP